MSDRSEGHSDDDEQSRKRPWLVGKEQQQIEKEKVTPSKRQKKNEKNKGFGGFLLNPFNSLYGMFYGDEKKKKKETKNREEAYEVADEEDDEVLVDSISPKKPEHSGSIIFLNDDRQVQGSAQRTPQRVAAGGEEVVIDRHVQRNVEVSDDSDENEEIQEVPVEGPPVRNHLERSFEVQQDDEPDIIFQHVVITPNKQLQEARRFENELIYLNDNPDTPDDVSVASGTRNQDFVSPAPEDSVSRPITPNLSNYSTNNVRDFWRRSTAKKTSSQTRVPVRHQFKYTSSIQRIASSGIQKVNKNKQILSSRDRLLQGIVASGQYDAQAITGITKQHKKTTPSSDVLARARNKIAEINASRSNTPSISRESSVIFEGSSLRRAPSPSSSIVSVSSTRTQQKFNDILSQINSLGIHSVHRGPQRYEKAYEQSRKTEDKLLEEARIREGHRAQTKGDNLENVRKKLELQGITIRPKEEKKKVDDFMGLPDTSDRILEKAWNNAMNPNEVFVDQFNIQISRKDLATLSGLHWLNDNVINYYLQMICDRSTNDSKYPKTYAFNTFFYTNIVTKGYASVKRWTRKVDIFSYEIILVPVHLGMHWCMAVIDMVEQKIEFYDSLYDGNTAVLPALKSYIEAESADKKKTSFSFDGWTIRQMEDIPRQKNGSDCGVFSCQFGEWASRRTAPRFTQKNMPYYRKRMVFEIVTKKLLATL